MCKKVVIYAEGLCLQNPGAGGFATILSYKDKTKLLKGNMQNTTSNRMALTAVVCGLSALHERCNTIIYTDNDYITNIVCRGYLSEWKENSWHKAGNARIANLDLWKELYTLMEKHIVSFIWYKGKKGELPYQCWIYARGESAIAEQIKRDLKHA